MPTIRPPESRESAATCCATLAAMRGEQRPVGGNRDADRGGEVDTEEWAGDLEAGSARRAPCGERPVGPRELEVLGDRGGLAGVGQQLRQRRRVLGCAECSVREIAGRGAGGDLRRGRPRVEVREQELGACPKLANASSSSVAEAAASPCGAARPLTASPAPAAERRRLRRFIVGPRTPVEEY